MLSETEALERILAQIPAPAGEFVPLAETPGRYALADALATLPLPPFDNSAMDGYAIHAADCGQTGRRLRVTGEQPAGVDRGLTVRPGECARVFTGAPLPRDTAAVVMQEDVTAEDGGAFIVINESTEAGEFIRRRGGDLCAGQLILRKGERITPQRLAALAGQGLERVECGRRPRARVLTTGDELVSPGQPLTAAGQIYNSNGPMLAALCAREGAETETAHARDELPALTAEIAAALETADLLVLAGGVSVGDHDLVKPALEQCGVPLEFWRVRLKPGKPFLFAKRGNTLVFGLPGNPASALVTATLFVLPALRRLAGAGPEQAPPPRAVARLATEVENRGDRPHYLRGTHAFSAGTFTPVGKQESHAVHGLGQSNALLRVEPGETIPAGAEREVVWL